MTARMHGCEGQRDVAAHYVRDVGITDFIFTFGCPYQTRNFRSDSPARRYAAHPVTPTRTLRLRFILHSLANSPVNQSLHSRSRASNLESRHKCQRTQALKELSNNFIGKAT